MTAKSSNDLRRRTSRRLSDSTAEVPVSSTVRLQHATEIAAQGGLRRLAHLLPSSRARSVADRKAAERVILSLGRLKGVPMKLGQLAGYVDSRIPDDLRPAFSALEDQAPALPFDQVRSVLKKQLGRKAKDLLYAMESKPIAVASIGQVHRAELDGAAVAVKIRHPGVEQTIEQDFRPLAVGSQAVASFRRKGQRGQAFINAVVARIAEECRYEREAERQQAFGRAFADHPVIEVPAVYPDHSTDAVLTTAFVDGEYLDAFLARRPSAEARRRAGIALVDFYVGALFVVGAYNADPHPGNYAFRPSGHIAVFDYGSGRAFDPQALPAMRALAAAALNDDRKRMRQALDELGLLGARRRVDEVPLYRVLLWFFRHLRDGQESTFRLPHAEELRDIARCVREFDAFDHPAELVFLIRLRVALSSVLARLQAKANWREVFEAHLAGDYFLRPANVDVVLVEPGARPIELLRLLRDEIGGAVRQAQALIEAVPSVVTSDVELKAGRALKARLEAAGAKVDLRSLE